MYTWTSFHPLVSTEEYDICTLYMGGSSIYDVSFLSAKIENNNIPDNELLLTLAM